LKKPQAFPAWVRQIVHHQCIDMLRTAAAERAQHLRASEENPPPSCAGPGLADIIAEQAAGRQFAQLLSGLSKKLRDTLLFFYVYGHPIEYIGDYLDIPPETVRKRLFDARRVLGRQLAGGQEEVDALLADLGRSHSAPLQTALTALDARQDSLALFEEGFEGGTVDTSIWIPVAGNPQVTDQCAHSGRYSYHIRPTHCDMIRHVFPERMVGSISFWIYDDTSKSLATMGIVSVLGGGPIDTNLRLGVFEEWAGDYYLLHTNNRGDRRHMRSTSVRRTTGWHQFQFEVDGRMTHAYIDGHKVGESGLLPCFSEFWVGDGWEGEGAETFVDDIEIRYMPAF
jgi:RNA polymerase sigma factor (sigma-70 family)